MGLAPFSSSSNDYSNNAPNPDPMNFNILSIRQIGKNVIVELCYPDCTNYKGLKICVFKNTNKKEVLSWEKIDPHFFESHLSPIARFKPTKEGWRLAISLAQIL